jgi:hypothetical protein
MNYVSDCLSKSSCHKTDAIINKLSKITCVGYVIKNKKTSVEGKLKLTNTYYNKSKNDNRTLALSL